MCKFCVILFYLNWLTFSKIMVRHSNVKKVDIDFEHVKNALLPVSIVLPPSIPLREFHRDSSKNFAYKLLDQVYAQSGSHRGLFGFVVDVTTTTLTIYPSKLCSTRKKGHVSRSYNLKRNC